MTLKERMGLRPGEGEAEKEDNYPTARMLRSMCRVYDPEDETACGYFVPCTVDNSFIEVYESSAGELSVRYCLIDDAPKGVEALLCEAKISRL